MQHDPFPHVSTGIDRIKGRLFATLWTMPMKDLGGCGNVAEWIYEMISEKWILHFVGLLDLSKDIGTYLQYLVPSMNEETGGRSVRNGIHLIAVW